MFLNLVEVLHHHELVEEELESVYHFLLVLLGLTRGLVRSLDLDLSYHQLDDDFKYSLIIHDEAGLRTLGLVAM